MDGQNKDSDPSLGSFPKYKQIAGMNFRQIVDSMEDDQSAFLDGNLYINSNAVISDESTIDTEVGSFFSRIKKSVALLARRVLVLSFVRDIALYLSTRSRILIVLSAVFAEVVAKQFEVTKRFFIRKMFWGRGNLFRFTLQFLGAFVIVIGFISFGYKGDDGVNYQLLSFAAGEETETLRNDLLVQNSSTRTQFTQNIGTTDYEIYIVKSGDTLSTIAKEVSKSKEKELGVDSIAWANNLSKNAVLKPGMELKIPPGNGLVIVVKEGDTLDALAKKYKTNDQLIVEWNILDYPFTLTPGQKLFLPEASIEIPKTQAPIYSGVIKASTGSKKPVSNVNRFLAWPVKGSAQVTQCYYLHNGIDLANKAYPELVASASGTVTFAGCQSGSCPPIGPNRGGKGLAWTVIIDHGNGLSTIYGHMSDIYVSTGQSVSQGQVIGKMGQSGLATGVHLHFMVVYSGTWRTLNPAPYMLDHICGY